MESKATPSVNMEVDRASGKWSIVPEKSLVDDWTNWSKFFTKLWQYTLASFDTLIWFIVSAITITLMAIAGTVSFWFIEPFAKLASHWMLSPFKIQKGSTNFHIPPSFVSSGTPNFFPDWTKYLNSAGVWQSLGPKLVDAKNLNEPTWDVDVARFMLHLGALAYEHPDVVSHFSTQWRLEISRVLKPELACYIYYSTQYPFVVVTFKGTSPFDLSEWLTDVMMVKVRPDGGVLPGQVHEGFYNTFSWDTPQVEDRAWSSHHQCDIEELLELLRSKVIPKVSSNPNQRINLWITGHSLGAALATVFLSHLTYLHTSPFNSNVKLRGAYTFGCPRVGDSTFASITESQNALSKVACFRVVNANDMIPALPLTSLLAFTPVHQVLRQSRGKAPNMMTDFEHVGTPVTLGYDNIVNLGDDRTWVSIGKNSIGYMMDWPRYFWHLSSGREKLGGFTSRCMQAFPYDHTPSEYDRHLTSQTR